MPAPVGWAILAGLCAAKILLHLFALGEYGYFRDELYYLASTDDLAFGYVDHPPLSILLLAAHTAIFGDSLPAIRLPPVLAGAGMVLLTGLIAARLGGGRFAQALAALCIVAAPIYMGTQGFYSMNAIDQLLWTAAALVVVALLQRDSARLWLVLGAVLGLGLLNKISVLWLGAGLAGGLLLTPHRRLLATRGPWLALGLAVLVFAPHLLWQIRNGWPTLEFIHNATQFKMAEVGIGDFIGDQLLGMNPATLPVWLSGLVYCLLTREGRPWRLLGIAFTLVAAILIASGSSRANYLAPAYPLIIAPGAVALERWLAQGRWRYLRIVLAANMAISGLVTAPLALPLLAPDRYVAYAQALGFAPRSEEKKAMAELPQHFADMFGWEEMAAEVAWVYRQLTPEERARCAVLAGNYGEAGAIDVLGARHGLPPAIGGHNNYWLWGPRGFSGELVIIIGGDRAVIAEFFASVEQMATVECARCMPYERDLPVYLARGLKIPVAEWWPQLKHYD